FWGRTHFARGSAGRRLQAERFDGAYGEVRRSRESIREENTAEPSQQPVDWPTRRSWNERRCELLRSRRRGFGKGLQEKYWHLSERVEGDNVLPPDGCDSRRGAC